MYRTILHVCKGALEICWAEREIKTKQTGKKKERKEKKTTSTAATAETKLIQADNYNFEDYCYCNNNNNKFISN